MNQLIFSKKSFKMGLLLQYLVLFNGKKTKNQMDEIIHNLPIQNAEYKELKYDAMLSDENQVDIYSGLYYIDKDQEDKDVGFDVNFTDIEQACLRFTTITKSYSYHLDNDMFSEILEQIPDTECVRYVSEDDDLWSAHNYQEMRKHIDDFNKMIESIKEYWEQKRLENENSSNNTVQS